MNWRKRAKVCRLQAWADNQFENHPIGGVQVINEQGQVEYLNSHPKTDWAKNLQIAEEHIAAEVIRLNLANQQRKQRNGL